LRALILGLWALWLEPASLKNKTYEIVLSSWPASCDGIRVAVLADLHVGSPYNGVYKLRQIVDLTLAAKPIYFAGRRLRGPQSARRRNLSSRKLSPEA